MSWKVTPPSDRNPVVTVVFDGFLSAQDGAASATAFRGAFGESPLDVVWDVTAMDGFDSGARMAWAEAIWPVRKQIKTLKIVGAKGMVRVGALFLAVFLGKPYEFADSDARGG